MSAPESQQTPNIALNFDQMHAIYNDHVALAGAMGLEIARLGLDGYVARAEKMLDIGLPDLIDNIAFSTVPSEGTSDQDVFRMAMPLQYGMIVGTQFARGVLTYRKGFPNFMSRMSDEMSALFHYVGLDGQETLNRLQVGGAAFLSDFAQSMDAGLHLFEQDDRIDKPANVAYRSALGYVAAIGFNMRVEHELREANSDYVNFDKYKNDRRLMREQMQEIQSLQTIDYSDCDPQLAD